MFKKRYNVFMTQRKCLLALCCLALAAFLAGLSAPVRAAPLRQMTPFPTPTPGPDGRIIYIVQDGDTLLRIALIAGITVDELRGLNSLTGDNIIVGQKLLLGLGGPSQVTPTAGPSPTPTPLLPTPSPLPGQGNLCVILYNDLNGDSIRQTDEPSVPGGAINVNNRAGSVPRIAQTQAGLDPQCFSDLPEGDYTVSVAIPDGYNPTTVTSYNLHLNPGDETFIDFGAQANTEAVAEAPTPTGSGRSPLLAIVGGVLLLAGAGLAVFASRLLKGK
jgi:LysM repeat protein